MALTLDGSNGVTFNDSSLQGAAASPYVLKNRIINGDMRIDQRNAGASISFTPAGTYPVDRFNGNIAQGSGHTAQRSTTAPTGFTNSIQITVGTGASPAAGSVARLYQAIEGFNTADFSWGTASASTVTLSFWVRSSLTGTFAGGLYNSAANRTYVFTYTISVANTWEQKTITIAGDTSGTWETGNGTSINVNWDLGTGSTYQGTAGSWAAGAAWATSGSVKLGATSGATFYITGVQLELGSTATPFERRLYNQELANCQRYFYLHAQGAEKSVSMGSMYTGSYLRTILPFQVTMRASPSLVQATGTDYYSFIRNATGDLFNSFAVDQTNTTCITIYNTSEISGTAGQAGDIKTNNASSFIGFSAEL